MTEIRHVLLCNDDGVFFPGIRALADAFLGAGWRVTVCAPDRERSAASHSMVLKDPYRGPAGEMGRCSMARRAWMSGRRAAHLRIACAWRCLS